MIRNDTELAATKERIEYFEHLLAQLRVTSSPEEFPFVASGYRAELESMNKDVVAYLTQHASANLPVDAMTSQGTAIRTESVP